MAFVKNYYAGGVRVVVTEIPIRLARKPSANNLKSLREHDKIAWEEHPSYFTSADRTKARVKAAADAIQTYAAMLEVTVEEARRRITVQREHVLANPVKDLSLEYDL